MIPEFPTPINVKQYTALLSQTGTAAPTQQQLQNTIGTVTTVRFGEGNYALRTSGLFTLNKTFITGLALGADNINDTIISLYGGVGKIRLQIADENDIYISIHNNTDTKVEWNTLLGTICFPTIYVFK